MHRFYVHHELPTEGVLLMHDAEILHQMRDVLKLKAGESVLLFNGTGFDFEFLIKKLEHNHVFGHVVRKIRNERVLPRRVALYQSLVKKNNFELIVAKCTELGVAEFCPFLSARSVKKGIPRERIEKILKESTEQCGGDIIPTLKSPVSFAEAVKALPKDEANILFDPQGKKWQYRADGAGKTNIFIGPEGGFTEEELKIFLDTGRKVYSLGPRILRSETAAIVATGLYLTG